MVVFVQSRMIGRVNSCPVFVPHISLRHPRLRLVTEPNIRLESSAFYSNDSVAVTLHKHTDFDDVENTRDTRNKQTKLIDPPHHGIEYVEKIYHLLLHRTLDFEQVVNSVAKILCNF